MSALTTLTLDVLRRILLAAAKRKLSAREREVSEDLLRRLVDNGVVIVVRGAE